jgi:hypothetical protein
MPSMMPHGQTSLENPMEISGPRSFCLIGFCMAREIFHLSLSLEKAMYSYTDSFIAFTLVMFFIVLGGLYKFFLHPSLPCLQPIEDIELRP